MLNYADVLICLIIFISIAMGIYKGFVKEIFSLASLGFALILAFYLADYPVQWLLPTAHNWDGELFDIKIEGESIVFVASFILIFVIALVIGNTVSNALSGLVAKTAILRSIDHVLGAAFGFLRGALIVMLLVVFAGLTKISIYPWWQQSQLLPLFVNGAQRIMILLPEQYLRHFEFDTPSEQGQPAELKPPPEYDANEHISL